MVVGNVVVCGNYVCCYCFSVLVMVCLVSGVMCVYFVGVGCMLLVVRIGLSLLLVLVSVW